MRLGRKVGRMLTTVDAEAGGESGREARVGERAPHQQYLLAQSPGHDPCRLQIRLCSPAWYIQHGIHTHPAGQRL